MSYRKATIKAAAAARLPPIKVPSLEAAPVKGAIPVAEAAMVKLAVVLVAVLFEKVPTVVTAPEPLPASEPDPVTTAAVVAGTKAATPVEPASVTVEKTTWGTVRMVEMMTVVEDPAMVKPSLTPAVSVAA